MNEQQAKLDQCTADIDKLIEEQKRLLREIKDAEVTYSIGDRFKKGGEKLLLAVQTVGDNSVALVCLEDGCLWSGSHEVEDTEKITQKELSGMSSCVFNSLLGQ